MIKNPNCANCSFVICEKNCPHPQNSSIKLLLRKIHDVIFTSTLANKTIEIFIYFICSSCEGVWRGGGIRPPLSELLVPSKQGIGHQACLGFGEMLPTFPSTSRLAYISLISE